jgi:hypothetical protein
LEYYSKVGGFKGKNIFFAAFTVPLWAMLFKLAFQISGQSFLIGPLRLRMGVGMPGGGDRWTGVALKRELAERARRFVNTWLGYRSLSELVEDAVRRRLEELERLYGPHLARGSEGGKGGESG